MVGFVVDGHIIYSPCAVQEFEEAGYETITYGILRSYVAICSTMTTAMLLSESQLMTLLVIGSSVS